MTPTSRLPERVWVHGTQEGRSLRQMAETVCRVGRE
jgi:hypothetical protein